MNKYIKCQKFEINEESPCFIIAEAGVNHNGDIEKAKLLIDIAKEAGADAVKFQTWITENILTKDVKQAEYQALNTGLMETQFDMLKKLELSFEDFRELKEYATYKGILFLSTPDDEESMKFLDSIGMPLFKIGSGELTNQFMLRKFARTLKPIILSTGMANLEEISWALNILYETGNKNIILLHCTSNYPTDPKDVNLNAMITLKNEFKTLVGYSDHTMGIVAPIIAVSLGAKVIEKHFTYDPTANGPDHICSLNPQQLKQMVKNIRLTEKMLGSYEKKPTDDEFITKKLVRKTLVAKILIKKGSLIKREHIVAKRSEGQISTLDIEKIIGKKAKFDILPDKALEYSYFE